MSDISFKQAKELVDGLELAEISIKKAVQELDKSSKNFEEVLKKQNFVLALLPQQSTKLLLLKLIIAFNVGFIGGIIFAKFFL